MDERPTRICGDKDCENTFPAYDTIQKYCIPCGIRKAKEKKKKEYDKETRRLRREFRAKDRSYQLKKAQIAFNAYIIERDKAYPCISCGSYSGKASCGHYKSVGAHPELRFDEDNAHKQCWFNCNSNKSGNIINYRIGLLDRIGEARVAKIEGPHEPLNLTLEEIIEIKNKYRKKLKKLQDN